MTLMLHVGTFKCGCGGQSEQKDLAEEEEEEENLHVVPFSGRKQYRAQNSPLKALLSELLLSEIIGFLLVL